MHQSNAHSGHTRVGRRQLLAKTSLAAASLVAGGSFGAHPTVAQAEEGLPFDISSGYAPIEKIIPTVIPQVYAYVSPVANDATLILRITTLITHAWFDAIAPYHPTAVGISSRIPRQPVSEATTFNKNIALLFASHRVLSSLLPRQRAAWDTMLTSLGLDPTVERQDTNNPVGIGNMAGFAVVAERADDGMNQMGDGGGRAFHYKPYDNSDGYVPVNTAYKLTDPARWQPGIMSTGNGIFVVQQCVTPQLRSTKPYSYTDLDEFASPPPIMSDPNTPAYKLQADEVLAASAGLTDAQKMVAELFDDKFMGLGFSSLFAATSRDLSLDDLVFYDFVTSMASFDTSIAVWNEKLRHDAVRPFSAIPWLYGDEPVTAWGGPGKGTVSDIPGREWQSYLGTADHPEYPSGSAAFCSAHAEASRRFFGSDEFGWAVPRVAGSSRIEPDITPSEDIVLGPWETWTNFEHECGLSRVWAGVHFHSSVPAGQAIGHEIGKRAHAFVQAHIVGDA